MATPVFIRNVVFNAENNGTLNKCDTDSSGNIWIAYRLDSTGAPRLVKYNRSGSVLVTDFAVEAAVVAGGLSLKVDSNDKPVISYIVGNTLRVARFTGAGGADIVPTSYGTSVEANAIDMCLDSSNNAYIAYKRFAGNKEISTVKFTVGTSTFGSANVIGTDSSIPGVPKIDSNNSNLIVLFWYKASTLDYIAAKIDTTNATVIGETLITTSATAANGNNYDVEVAEDGKIYYFYEHSSDTDLYSLSQTAPSTSFVADTATTERHNTIDVTQIVLDSDSDSNIHVYYKTGTGAISVYSVYTSSFGATLVNQVTINTTGDNIQQNDLCISNQDEAWFIYADTDNGSDGTYQQWTTGFTIGVLPRVIII